MDTIAPIISPISGPPSGLASSSRRIITSPPSFPSGRIQPTSDMSETINNRNIKIDNVGVGENEGEDREHEEFNGSESDEGASIERDVLEDEDTLNEYYRNMADPKFRIRLRRGLS